MPTGTAASPWWAAALLILVAVIIVITLVVLVAEMIRNIGAGRKHDQPPPTHDTKDLNSPVA
jgi:putative exporter of polyketide antibiotics